MERSNTPSERARDPMFREMDDESWLVREGILDGYRDPAEGAVFTSTGRFDLDMAVLEEKEANGWQRSNPPSN